MIFVAVQALSEIVSAEADVQNSINTSWKRTVEENVGRANERIVRMTEWLLANAKGGYREWVEIERREPATSGDQTIIGYGGYRFRDPEEALRFKEVFGEPS